MGCGVPGVPGAPGVLVAITANGFQRNPHLSAVIWPPCEFFIVRVTQLNPLKKGRLGPPAHRLRPRRRRDGWKYTARSLGRRNDFTNSSRAIAVQFCVLSIYLLDVARQRLKRRVRGLTWGEVLVDGPVVHLKCGIAPISGEAHYVVLAVIYCHTALLHDDVNRTDVEYDSNFALLLETQQGRAQF